MPIYLCRWPDGDVSMVTAEDEDEARDVLDEIGDPSDVAISEFEGPLNVTLCLNDTGGLMLSPDHMDNSMFRVLRQAYPTLALVENVIDAERSEEDRTSEDLEKIRQAVIVERGGDDVHR